MTIEEQKNSEFNKEVDTIITSMPNESKSFQFKYLKGIISQSQEIISEKILMTGKNKTKTEFSYIDYNMILNSPSDMADGKENSSPPIKNEEYFYKNEKIDSDIPYSSEIDVDDQYDRIEPVL
ncbi:hypothetical protein AYI68_g4012 [Smittium mucronatum]|uniref:Uncharacterized protein n=1 Tax=Smittium mucronatum TaxID=133383 RepID=A0A1R0GY95_9FUNG|nr:hypothetical protein AYI68_g4012 [Smittium mucronatum]